MEASEVKELLKSKKNSSDTRKAEDYAVQLNAEHEMARHRFLVNHVGMKAQANGGFYSCDANDQIMREYMKAHNLDGTKPEHWESAFGATRDRLAVPDAEPYERRTNTKDHLFMPQSKYTEIPKPSAIPHTKEQLLEMSRTDLPRFRSLMARHLKAINKILRGEN